jgi:glycosyltransferase involved in cell wall biosynthesis
VFNIMLSRELGGIQQAFLDYSEALRQAGVEVINISSWRAAINAFQPEALRLPNFAPWCPFSKLYLRFLIRRYRPNMVIAHGGRAIQFATAFNAPNTQIIGVAHNCWAYHRLKKTDYLICVTEHIKHYLQAQGYEKMRIFTIPNMLRLCGPYRPFQLAPGKTPGKPIVIGSYGRLSEEKGFAELIQSIDLLKKRGYPVKLLLGGSGALEHALTQQVAALGLEQEVILLGWVTDKEAFFKEIDLFCLPSLEEAFGIALLEAMAHSKPIVASNVSGPAEILSHGTDALLAEPASPQDLADKLADYMDHPEKAALFADKAYQKGRDTYEMTQVSERLLGVLQHISTTP